MFLLPQRDWILAPFKGIIQTYAGIYLDKVVRERPISFKLVGASDKLQACC